jgi:hypothetical protein
MFDDHGLSNERTVFSHHTWEDSSGYWHYGMMRTDRFGKLPVPPNAVAAMEQREILIRLSLAYPPLTAGFGN